MSAQSILIDANLLVLLVVGRTRRSLIADHKRLSSFTAEDYDLLLSVIGSRTIVVTPNTLTEASNLLKQRRFRDVLRDIIYGSKEVTVMSVKASSSRLFSRLGLTDAALEIVASNKVPLLTVDLDLWTAVSSKHVSAALNFWHLKEQD